MHPDDEYRHRANVEYARLMELAIGAKAARIKPIEEATDQIAPNERELLEDIVDLMDKFEAEVKELIKFKKFVWKNVGDALDGIIGEHEALDNINHKLHGGEDL